MTNKPMFSQLNALSLAGQLGAWGVCVAGVASVRALQSLWQHPVIHCILSNNLFGASVVFPDNITENQAYIMLLHYCAMGNTSAGQGQQPAPY